MSQSTFHPARRTSWRGAGQLARHLAGPSALALTLLGCSNKPPDMPPPDPVPTGPCATAGYSAKTRFPSGSRDGHADPLGAKAALQARASRISTTDWIVQGPEARQKVRLGDVILINDKIAAYIEAPGESDGYMPYGGDLLELSPVGADGKPTGPSQYGETLLTMGRQSVAPESVTILNDGSDGKAAVVRVSGALRNIPFLDSFMVLAPDEYGFPAALDYSLAPGSRSIQVRLSLINHTSDKKDLSRVQFLGFFHSSRSQMFTPDFGYTSPAGNVPWVGFDNGGASFAMRMAGGMNYVIDTSGFSLFRGPGLSLEACESRVLDYMELATGPSLDAVAETMRAAGGENAWRTVHGTVKLPDGSPVAGAQVHATLASGAYLARTTSNATGEYSLHVPAAEVQLTPTQPGFVMPAAVKATATQDTVPLILGAFGTLVVHARDAADKSALPVRVQVIPAKDPGHAPDAFGVAGEAYGRLLNDFAITGESRLQVPVGVQRIIVSHGYEWELLDQTVMIEAGKTTELTASLVHSVDSTGVMCADFHIHSFYSADSSDPVETKVRTALADGLELPISSEHEWIIDFQPVIQRLGMTAFAYSIPSEEFTTFTWGHFGIIPLMPRPEQVNNGAMPWIGKKPREVFHNIAELPEHPVLIVNHPRSSSYSQGYFQVADFDRSSAMGDPELWSDEFGAVEVFNDSDLEQNRSKSLADWFALINHGKKVWAVGSSDSHRYHTSPVGYPRTCMHFGHDDPRLLSGDKIRDTLRSGDAVVSGGLYMTVTGPGGVRPGGTIAMASGPQTFQVVVQTPKWLSAKRLEIIVDGDTVATKELQETVVPQGRRYELSIPVTPPTGRSGPHWVVFHASSDIDLAPLHPGRRPFAVSNPVFF